MNPEQFFNSFLNDAVDKGLKPNQVFNERERIWRENIQPALVKKGANETDLTNAMKRWQEKTNAPMMQLGFLPKDGQNSRGAAKDLRAERAVRESVKTGSKLPLIKETALSTADTLANAFGQGANNMVGSIARFANDIGENEKGTTLDRIANSSDSTAKAFGKSASSQQTAMQSGEMGKAAQLGIGAVQSIPAMALPMGAAAGTTKVLGGIAKTAAPYFGLGVGTIAGHTQNYGEVRQGATQNLQQDFPTWQELQGNPLYEQKFNENLNAGLSVDQSRQKAHADTLDTLSESAADKYGTAMTALDIIAPSGAVLGSGILKKIPNSTIGNIIAGGKVNQKLVQQELKAAERTGISKYLPDVSLEANKAALKMVGKQGLEEGLQGAIGEYGSQSASANIGGKPIDWKQVGQSFIDEGIVGAIMGGGMQSASGHTPTGQAKAIAKELRNQTNALRKDEALARNNLSEAMQFNNPERVAEAENDLQLIQERAKNLHDGYTQFGIDTPYFVQRLIPKDQEPGTNQDQQTQLQQAQPEDLPEPAPTQEPIAEQAPAQPSFKPAGYDMADTTNLVVKAVSDGVLSLDQAEKIQRDPVAGAVFGHAINGDKASAQQTIMDAISNGVIDLPQAESLSKDIDVFANLHSQMPESEVAAPLEPVKPTLTSIVNNHVKEQVNAGINQPELNDFGYVPQGLSTAQPDLNLSTFDTTEPQFIQQEQSGIIDNNEPQEQNIEAPIEYNQLQPDQQQFETGNSVPESQNPTAQPEQGDNSLFSGQSTDLNQSFADKFRDAHLNNPSLKPKLINDEIALGRNRADVLKEVNELVSAMPKQDQIQSQNNVSVKPESIDMKPERVDAGDISDQAQTVVAPVDTTQDIGRASDNKPFLNKPSANRALKQQNLNESHSVIEVAKNQFVLRPKQLPTSLPESIEQSVTQSTNVATDPISEEIGRASDNKPFANQQSASIALKKKGLAKTHFVSKTEGGYVLRPSIPIIDNAIDAAANEAATSPHNDTPEPTQAQIEAGNYKKGHVNIQGLDISIENPKGSTRSGKRPDGSEWSHTMSDHYGYIKRTTGADNEHIDTYVGNHPESDHVFVVDQLDQQTGGFDEHKVMLGFNDLDSATKAYKSNFDDGWKVGPIKSMNIDEFKDWLKNGDTTRPTTDIKNFSKNVSKNVTTQIHSNAGITHNIPENLLDQSHKLGDVVEDLAKMSSDVESDTQYSEKLLRKIAQLNPDVEVHIVSDLDKITDKAVRVRVNSGGFYIPDRNLLYINPRSELWEGSIVELLNHELTHTVTESLITSKKVSNEVLGKLEQFKNALGDYIWTHGENLDENIAERLRYAYEQDFPHELLAVGISETNVREVFKKMLGEDGLKQLDKIFTEISTNQFKEKENDRLSSRSQSQQQSRDRSENLSTGDTRATDPDGTDVESGNGVTSSTPNKFSRTQESPTRTSTTNIANGQHSDNRIKGVREDSGRGFKQTLARIPEEKQQLDTVFGVLPQGNAIERVISFLDHLKMPATQDASSNGRFNVRLDGGSEISGTDNHGFTLQVVTGFTDLPKVIQQAATYQDEHGKTQNYSVSGVWHDDTLYVVTDQIYGDRAKQFTTSDAYEELLAHEIIGHFGVQQVFGKEYKTKFQQLYNALGGQPGILKIAKDNGVDVKQFKEAYIDPFTKGIKEGYYDPLDVQQATVSELFAFIAQNEKTRPFVQQKLKELLGYIRQWFRDHGLMSLDKYNDADIMMFLAEARKAVVDRDMYGKFDEQTVTQNINKKGQQYDTDGLQLPQELHSIADLSKSNSNTKDQTIPKFSRKLAANPEDLPKATQHKILDAASKSFFGQAALLGLERSKTISKQTGRLFSTMLHKALQDSDFKVTFDLVQDKINHVTFASSASMDVAPDILTQLETGSDYWKESKKVGQQLAHTLNLRDKPEFQKDLETVGDVLFENTLSEEPKVFNDQELRDKKLTQNQIDLYHQARDAIDTSLDSFAKTTISNIYKHLGGKSDEILAITAKDLTLGGHVNEIADRIAKIVENDPDKAEAAKIAEEHIDKVVTRLEQLKVQGYMPLMRFGKYYMRVVDPTTKEVAYRQHFESEAERNLFVRNYKAPDGYKVESSQINELEHKLFQGVSPETVALFAKEAGLPVGDAEAAYIKHAVRDNHALKRLLRRQGVQGFNTDTKRVLASFVLSNARYAANQLYNPAIDESITEIKDPAYAEDAIRLRDYALDTQEEVAGIKNFAFVWYMGASFMFGVVNLTQPLLQTLPYLLQYSTDAGSVPRAFIRAAKSWYGKDIPTKYQDFYERARREGHLDPQNTWMLQGLERGKSGLGASTWQLISHASGFFAQASETVNRRTALFAALDVAESMGKAKLEKLGFKDAYDFAVRTIQETQGIYNKGNRPRVARGNVGSILMMYKQFMISYVEQMVRMQRAGLWGGEEDEFKKRMAALVGFGISRTMLVALGVLWSFAGATGLPFVRDLLDVIETAGGMIGKPVNTEREAQIALTKALGDTLGTAATTILLDGPVNLNPVIDVKGRMGMGDLIPATSYFSPMTSEWQKSKELSGLGGAIGGLMEKASSAMDYAQVGAYGEALTQLAPKALTSGKQGYDAAVTGDYRNMQTGVKTNDATILDGFIKMLDAQPSGIAKEGRIRGLEMKDKAALQYVNKRAKEDYNKVLESGDQKQIIEFRKAIEDYNATDPRYPITMNLKRAETNFAKSNKNWQEKRKTTKGLDWMDDYNPYLETEQ
ncbi:PLxRFG domain-containing protein [Acinetobacter ursingii]|uniref:PLxRFG domain-containing protein n=1 Tax=Acinetobacter ursingii TaxID=108980 RepID=UPI00124C8568|nr:PLxRFG domain-containing protein [Acinetobacter ursingii]